MEGKSKFTISEKVFDARIKDQFYALDKELELAVTDDVKLALLVDTVWGRAKKGHGLFKDEARPKIKRERICTASGINPNAMKEFKWNLNNNLYEGLINGINSNKKELTDKYCVPYLGITFLSRFPVGQEKKFYQQFAIVGLMDNESFRKKTVKKYKTTLEGKTLSIGRGKEILIDTNLLQKYKIKRNSLAEKAHSEKEIAFMENIGIIAKEEDIGKPGVENIYLKYEKEFGICDDMAISAGGIIGYNIEGMIGGTLADGVDSHAKFVPTRISGGMDEWMAIQIMKAWKQKYNEDLITEDNIMEIIYLGAKNNIKIGAHSSSHRRLVQWEKNSNRPTILQHINFVNSGRYENFKLGYEQISSKKFYENLKDRFNIYKNGKYSIKLNPTQPFI